MALIVVCEDDASTRTLIVAVLVKAGHLVEAFDNGLKGYARLIEGDVELLISDVQMPGKNGFALVSDLREDKQLTALPCILLTSLQERSHMRIGMTSGANDYVTKPFKPAELLDAVNSQLKRAMQLHLMHVDETIRSVDAAVGKRTNELMDMYEKRLQRELQSRWTRSDTDHTELRGSLISCSIMHQSSWLKLLSNSMMADMARHFYTKVVDCAALFNAEHVQFVGDGLLIVFDAKADTPSVEHAARAQRLLHSFDAINTSLRAYVKALMAPALKGLTAPIFQSCLAVHEGQLSLGKLDDVVGGLEHLVPVGRDVQFLSKLSKSAHSLGWPLLFSAEAVEQWKSQGIHVSIADQHAVKVGDQVLTLYHAE
jgi:DNA-binding response OmpR family regulator